MVRVHVLLITQKLFYQFKRASLPAPFQAETEAHPVRKGFCLCRSESEIRKENGF